MNLFFTYSCASFIDLNCIHESMRICHELKCEKQIDIFYKREIRSENCFKDDSLKKTIKFAQKMR